MAKLAGKPLATVIITKDATVTSDILREAILQSRKENNPVNIMNWGHSLTEADVERIASWDLNGREIKNACKTVRTWCLCQGYRMELVRVESAIQVTAPQARRVGE